ncbi:MAG TPA: replication restart DNA helicase PriA [Xenococcaceae cyanobacterium]
MPKIQNIYCPNCGDRATRINLLKAKITQTSCPHCDYLLVQCSETARVIEAYAPGLFPSRGSQLSTSSIGS